MNPKYLFVAGQRFGRLTIHGVGKKTKWGQSRWHCICDCGNHTHCTASHLMSGDTRSCGCYRAEQVSITSSTHGAKRKSVELKEYRSWQDAKLRCGNPHNVGYKNYGGRGIKMCPQWLTSFPQFFADMGPCPHGFTLDRVDNSKGYSPDNCRWASRTEQNNNTRQNRFIEWNGKRLTSAQWDREQGFRPLTVTRRLHLGWSIERTLTQKVIPSRKLTKIQVTKIRNASAKIKNVELAKQFNVGESTICEIRKGRRCKC